MSKTHATTILFADVCRSTQLFQAYGDRKARKIIGHALQVMDSVISRCGGEVVKTIGDEVMCTVDSPDKAVLAACEIHRRIGGDKMLKQYNLAVRIGLHYGDVLLEGGDVFGDAVNVAAQMVESAKREQIVSSRTTLKVLSRSTNIRSRDLGRTKIRGKRDLLELKEVLWQEDTSKITAETRVLGAKLLARVQLTLRFRNDLMTMKATSQGFSLGRDPRSDLVIDEEWVSRDHAAIEFRTRSFVFIDHSTNGSYLKSGKEDSLYLHRDQAPLREQGVISLGREITPGASQLIFFQCRY